MSGSWEISLLFSNHPAVPADCVLRSFMCRTEALREGRERVEGRMDRRYIYKAITWALFSKSLVLRTLLVKGVVKIN